MASSQQADMTDMMNKEKKQNPKNYKNQIQKELPKGVESSMKENVRAISLSLC